MVIRKKSYNELLAKIEGLENEVKDLKEERKKVFKCLKGLNEKITKHIKNENEANEEVDRIIDWLSDERIDEVQSFIKKGNK